MAERFYVSSSLDRGTVLLQGAEAHHLTAVRRFRPGEQVYLFNGDGREYRAVITRRGRREVELEVIDWAQPVLELTGRLLVACPLPKGDRGQFLVEKLTELGATTYVPLRTERSVVHPAEGRQGRLERHVIEASKQCGRNVLMTIEPISSLSGFLARTDLPSCKVIADQSGSPAVPETTAKDVAVAVGPEGGFTKQELEQALAMGWRPVCLGPRTLRVETAAIALAALLGMKRESAG